jgi:hypothetical protein
MPASVSSGRGTDVAGLYQARRNLQHEDGTGARTVTLTALHTLSFPFFPDWLNASAPKPVRSSLISGQIRAASRRTSTSLITAIPIFC